MENRLHLFMNSHTQYSNYFSYDFHSIMIFHSTNYQRCSQLNSKLIDKSIWLGMSWEEFQLFVNNYFVNFITLYYLVQSMKLSESQYIKFQSSPTQILLYKTTMEAQQDPFAFFENPKDTQISNIDKPRKKIHIESMTKLNSEIIVNKFGDDKNRMIDQGAADSDNEVNKNRLEDISIEVQRNEEGCIHEVFYPKGYERKVYTGPCTARKYKFTLDSFQQKAVRAIQSDQSVLVCAHTSAGKTAIAQYAISVCMRDRSRVIYTSPIKALSNQKYRQLKKDFNDVGLVTGDVTIDQSASCLVMTTQILRNMIYRGSQIVRQIKWVIFDQVHYMRDKERGVVWEETIILLQDVKFVFLSATIGNPQQFACWITKLKKEPCNVVYTDYRPVPLEHYLCPAGGDGLYLVVDQNGKFHDNHFNKAVELLGQTVNIIGLDKRKKMNMNQGADLSKIIKVIIERSMEPAIVFSFSKRDVQSFTRSAATKYDLATADNKEKIASIFEDAIAVLDEVDRDLATITAIKGILMKGIGIHHGGLLPLLKETVEVLFQAGLIKILFSTETFSMGINMPAKTVIFTSVRKFDGETFRWIGGGQYIQMSGRAGRRGLDKKGITILMIDEKMQPQSAKAMLKGKSDDLLSSFYINYNMLLNSQRLQDIDPDYILARSFLQFQHDAKLPKILEEHQKKIEQYRAQQFQNQAEMEQFYLINQKLDQAKEKLRILIFTPKNILQYLNVGRVVKIKDGSTNWGYGYMVNFHKKDKSKKKSQQANDSVFYVADIMVHVKRHRINDNFQPISYTEDGEMVVLTFVLSCICEITALKITHMPADLTQQQSKRALKATMVQLTKKKFQTINIPCNRSQAIEYCKIVETLEQQIAHYNHLLPLLDKYRQRRKLHDEIKQQGKKIKELSGIVLRKEKKAYLRVLKRMGLIQKGVVTRKGNVTCGISSNHEILLTELLFSGFFNDMNSLQIAALLTSLCHQQKASSDRKYTKNPRLKAKLNQLLNEAKNIYKILHQCKVQIEEDQYMESIKQNLIQAAYEWGSGSTFAQICKMTETYEGSIIRTFRRLNELLKNMSTVSKQIGNEQLSAKFDEGGIKIFRGIVQAASLYTT